MLYGSMTRGAVAARGRDARALPGRGVIQK